MSPTVNVCVVGAAGGIGQSLCLLLKTYGDIGRLSLVDISSCPTPIGGVAADISHINTSAAVKSYTTPDRLSEALLDAHIVVISAGCVSLKPGMNRDSLFDSSAGIISSLAEACASQCPSALVAIITNPVNSMVPIFVEKLRKRGILDASKRVFGVTTLDVVRASTFVAHECGLEPKITHVPVVGGHGGESILALVSQTQPAISLTADIQEALEKRINNAAFDVIAAKNGAGSATLSMAYAAWRFCETLINAITGDQKSLVYDYAYVSTESIAPVAGLGSDDRYFAGRCALNASGLVAMDPIPVASLTDYERRRLHEAKAKCKADVLKAFEYLRNH